MKRRSFLARLAGTSALAVTPLVHTDATARGPHTASAQASPVAGAGPIAAIDTRRAALLVMDYQVAWLETLPDPDAPVARAADAIAIARERGLHLAWCRVAFMQADYAAVPSGNVIFTQLTREPGALDEDAPRTAIDARVAPEPGDKVIRKTRVGAFARTDLDGWLRALGIDTLILAGISTSGVVLSTVCDAADRDYRVIVLADACADRDAEIQDVLMQKIFPQRAQVIAVDALPALL